MESEVSGGGGGRFLLKIPGGPEGPGGCLRLGFLGGGGAKYFFRGRNVHHFFAWQDVRGQEAWEYTPAGNAYLPIFFFRLCP